MEVQENLNRKHIWKPVDVFTSCPLVFNAVREFLVKGCKIFEITLWKLSVLMTRSIFLIVIVLMWLYAIEGASDLLLTIYLRCKIIPI